MRNRLRRLLVLLSTPTPRLTRGRAIATTLLELLGIGSIVTGIALLSLSAALIVGGIALIVISWRATR